MNDEINIGDIVIGKKMSEVSHLSTGNATYQPKLVGNVYRISHRHKNSDGNVYVQLVDLTGEAVKPRVVNIERIRKL